MKTTTKKWRSPSLGRDMEITVFGTSGTPLLAIPTRAQNNLQWHRYGMIDAVAPQVDEGFNQIFCISSVDDESFLNPKIDPRKRVLRNQQFESYVIEEVLPFVKEQNPGKFLMIAGTDTGGYHALNLAFKHPAKFGKVISMSGIYNIKPFMNGYFDEDVYFDNPVDYMVNLHNNSLLEKIRDLDIRMLTYASDPRREDAQEMSNVLWRKSIHHDMDVWEDEASEWELWQYMLKNHIV